MIAASATKGSALPTARRFTWLRWRSPLRPRFGLGGVGETVRVELIGGKRAELREIVPRRIDHQRCAARVDLVAGKIRIVFQHRRMDESRAAGPRIFGAGLGQHRDELE